MSTTSISSEKRFLRPDELMNNNVHQVTWFDKVVETIIFPFTWLAMVLQFKKPTLQQQLAQQIMAQEHARISSMRQSAMMKADAARSQVMRDELAKIYEETLDADLKMSYLIEALSRGVSFDNIQKSLDNGAHRVVRDNQNIIASQRTPVRMDNGSRFDPHSR